MAPSIAVFTLVQALIGAGSSTIFGPLMADISHWFERRRGVAVSVAAAGNYLAGTLWPVVMPSMMDYGGWRFVYLATGAICLVTMAPLALMLRRQRPQREAGAASAARPLLSIPLSPAALQALLVVAALGCCVAMSMPQVHIVAYCVDLGYGVARGGEMLSIMLAAGVVSRLASGFLADRIGGVKTLLVGSTLQCLSLLPLHPLRRARLALCRVAGVRPVAGRHRALLCDHRARIHAGGGSRPAHRHRDRGVDRRHGHRRLDVRPDLRP